MILGFFWLSGGGVVREESVMLSRFAVGALSPSCRVCSWGFAQIVVVVVSARCRCSSAFCSSRCRKSSSKFLCLVRNMASSELRSSMVGSGEEASGLHGAGDSVSLGVGLSGVSPRELVVGEVVISPVWRRGADRLPMSCISLDGRAVRS